MKFGLEGISRLLRQLGNPQTEFRSVHVAGTNGKGSTASMVAAILTAAGYRTGLYTSPHLIRFEERIRINGKPITKRAVTDLTNQLSRSLRRNRPTYFEATTAIAFKYFADEGVEVALVETGLGGRLDSTNVLQPMASVITNISLEHTEILGSTVEKIALEKAGIVKKNTPCIAGIRDEKALSVLTKVCKKMKAPLIVANAYETQVRKISLAGTLVDVKTDNNFYKRLWVSLPGAFQLENLKIALGAVQSLQLQNHLEIGEAAIRSGLSTIQELSGLRGRLMTLEGWPRIIVDVAHNVDGVRNLVESLRRLKVKNPIVVFGVLREKDYVSMVHDLASITDKAIAVAARSERSRPSSDVAAAFQGENCSVHAALSVEEGVRLAVRMAGPGRTILVTGSHFVVGEALAALERKRA